jgi:hypothetical protein
LVRRILRPRGEDIVCVLKNYKLHYQHVRLLVSPYNSSS